MWSGSYGVLAKSDIQIKPTCASKMCPVLQGLLISHKTKPAAISFSSHPLSFTFIFSPQITELVSSSSLHSWSTVTCVWNRNEEFKIKIIFLKIQITLQFYFFYFLFKWAFISNSKIKIYCVGWLKERLVLLKTCLTIGEDPIRHNCDLNVGALK